MHARFSNSSSLDNALTGVILNGFCYAAVVFIFPFVSFNTVHDGSQVEVCVVYVHFETGVGGLLDDLRVRILAICNRINRTLVRLFATYSCVFPPAANKQARSQSAAYLPVLEPFFMLRHREYGPNSIAEYRFETIRSFFSIYSIAVCLLVVDVKFFVKVIVIARNRYWCTAFYVILHWYIIRINFFFFFCSDFSLYFSFFSTSCSCYCRHCRRHRRCCCYFFFFHILFFSSCYTHQLFYHR